jgi:ABC-2 type transport system permease protein
MWAIVVKEFRQLRRDRRTVAMLFLLPFLFLIVFGYAASFDVKTVPTVVVGPMAGAVRGGLPPQLDVVKADSGGGYREAYDAVRDGTAVVAVVTPTDLTVGKGQILVDGTEIFAARTAVAALAQLKASNEIGTLKAEVQVAGAKPVLVTPSPGAQPVKVKPGVPADAFTLGGLPVPAVKILFNPELRTSVIMIPGLCGIILVFVGTVATALGVVRERQAGTLEQLAVMPFRAWQVFLGKIAPYLLIAVIDMVLIVGAGLLVFNVPFRGSVLTFALGALLFLFVTLGVGVLISTVSQTQGQAIQLSIMTLLPQILLSGLFFPLYSMAAGVRWISYILPLTYFVKVARGVMVRGTPFVALWFPLLMLALLGTVVFTLSVLRFRRDLAPAGAKDEGGSDVAGAAEAST